MMREHYPILLVLLPLLAALCTALAGWVNRRLCFWLALAGLGGGLVTALGLAAQVAATGPVVYHLGGWEPPWGIAYAVDQLNAMVLVAVATVACLNLVSSRDWLENQPDFRVGPFYTLYVLAVVGLMGMVVTGDAFNLYVLLEISSLSGYAILAMGPAGRSQLAVLNYLFMGTIGASFYLLGVGYLYIMTGSLNMADIAGRLAPLYGKHAVLVAFIIIIIGLWLKAAFFPLHSWLPGAYGFAPPPAAGLLAPLATKVMIYVMLRMMLTVFTPAYTFREGMLNQAVVWLAVIAIVAGALLALSSRDFKTMLTYIIVSEVGYMVGGAWLGNRLALTGTILHLVGDAAMTLCVFLAAANLGRQLGGTSFTHLRGAFRRLPLTMAGLAVGGMALIGVPPTCGFFSKWYLISGGLAAGHYGYVAALVISSLVNVALFFRVFEIAYFEPLDAHGHGHGHQEPHAPVVPGGAAVLAGGEAPAAMVAPLLITAALLVGLGLSTGWLVRRLIAPFLPAGLG